MWLIRLVTLVACGISSINCDANPSSVCSLDFDGGFCRALSYVISFDKTEGRCVTRIYGGCGGNGNRFSSISECEETCAPMVTHRYEVPSPVCTLPPLLSPRTCHGFFPRFTFNAEVGRCERYIYGGCGASKNVFITIEECISACLPKPGTTRTLPQQSDAIQFPEVEQEQVPRFGGNQEETDLCSLPPVWPGPITCLALIPKWTFSKSDGACVPYTYGGCRGTGNLFDSLATCQATCPGKQKLKTAEVCSLPLTSGPCRALKPSFGFNPATGRCENFIYGGCRGNGNRFTTIEDCVSTCGGNKPDQETDCRDIVCNRGEAEMQRAKGCSPITLPGECCPSSWDCSQWETRVANKSLCFHSSVSNPEGRFYSPGESIEMDSSDGCRQGCFCADNGKGVSEIVCAIVDCFHPMDFSYDRCVATYRNVGSCCATQFKCDSERDELGHCEVEGKTYRHGEKIYPRKDPCLVCLCQDGWDGSSLTSPACMKVDCGLTMSPKLRDGCQPVYQDGVCCPVDWVCPTEVAAVDPLPVSALEQSPAGIFGVERATALKASDLCLLPIEAGPCEALIPRFVFDKATGRCEEFLYGGCQGNANNFHSLKECIEACHEYGAEDESSDMMVGGDTGREVQKFLGLVERCNQAVEVGACRSRLKKFFFNSNSGNCEAFFYSGCRGGENMFDDLRECVRTCVQPSAISRFEQLTPKQDSCDQPTAIGICRAFKPRWTFNRETGRCEKFNYGGCLGNSNNFENEAACESACVEKIIEIDGPLINIGPVITLPEQVPQSLPDDPSRGRTGGSCPGCPFASNIDAEIKKVAALGAKKLASVTGVTGEECQHVQLLEVLSAQKQVVAGTNYILSLKMITKSGSNCDVKNTRICSNIYIHKPLPFACSSNDLCLSIIREDGISCEDDDAIVITADNLAKNEDTNIVITPDLGTDEDAEDPCSLDREIGRCKAAIPRFYYDKLTGTCKQFYYGGCRGNKNNFASESDCQNTCVRSSSRAPRVGTRISVLEPKLNVVCGEPVDGGFCYALIARFYYNSLTGSCEEFIYGGCGGNGNNFGSVEECSATCNRDSHTAKSFQLQLSTPPMCKFGDKLYAVGDIVRLNNDPCQACVCSSPPDLSCTIRKCPLIAPVSRQREGCREVRDQLGCCVEGYHCSDADVDESLPPPGGIGFPMPGGSREVGIDHDIKMVAARAQSRLTEIAAVTGVQCQETKPQLLEILEAKKQVVAGTNYILSLRLQASTGPLCEDKMERYCRNLTVHKPLFCTERDYETCLELVRPDNIECFHTREELL